MLAKANPTVVILAGLGAFVAVLAGLLGLYALAPDKPNVAPLFAALPGALAAAVSFLVAWRQKQHGAQLTTITANTNGVLTARIKQAVSESVPIAVATALATNTPAPEVFVPAQPTSSPVAELVPSDGGPA